MLNPHDLVTPVDQPDIYDEAEQHLDRSINVIGWMAFGFVLGLLVASFALWFPALTSSVGNTGASATDVIASADGASK